MALPPGPRTPSQLQLFEWLVRPIRFLERNHRRYGDFFAMKLVGFDAIVISDPVLIKQVFTGDPDVLHAGEANAAPLEPLLGRNSVLLLDGPEHIRQRKLMLPSFQGERMRSYGQLIAELTEDEIDRFPVGESFALRDYTQSLTLEVIMRAVFGIEDARRLDQLRSALTDLLSFGENTLALAALAMPGVRTTIGRRVWRRFAADRERVDQLLFAEIADRRAAADTVERADVMSILLQARDEDGRPMTDQELRDELMTLLVAGHETTATALAWSFDLLLHNPDALAKLRAELAELPQGGEYLDGVIKETLRLRPVIPAVARRLVEPVEINGYVIPAGARLTPNVYLTHRRPDVYPEPDRFNPGRYAQQGVDTYSWIPFGGGIRRCLGAAFALYEMQVAIPLILSRVELRTASGAPEQIRRRAITFVPEHDTRVLVTSVRPRSERAPSPAASVI